MSARGWGERLGKGRGRGARRDGEPVGSACVYFQQGAPAVSLTAPRPDPGPWAGWRLVQQPVQADPGDHKEGQQQVTVEPVQSRGHAESGWPPPGPQTGLPSGGAQSFWKVL